jgi:hypothetical protein
VEVNPGSKVDTAKSGQIMLYVTLHKIQSKGSKGPSGYYVVAPGSNFGHLEQTLEEV